MFVHRLRFSVAFWHSFKGDGSDPFGSGTKAWPWNADKDPLQAAFKAMHANFELMSKLGIDRWCFHDRSVDNHWQRSCQHQHVQGVNGKAKTKLTAELIPRGIEQPAAEQVKVLAVEVAAQGHSQACPAVGADVGSALARRCFHSAYSVLASCADCGCLWQAASATVFNLCFAVLCAGTLRPWART